MSVKFNLFVNVLCSCKIAIALRRPDSIAERIQVFNLPAREKGLSAVAEVAGLTSSNFNKLTIFGVQLMLLTFRTLQDVIKTFNNISI